MSEIEIRMSELSGKGSKNNCSPVMLGPCIPTSSTLSTTNTKSNEQTSGESTDSFIIRKPDCHGVDALENEFCELDISRSKNLLSEEDVVRTISPVKVAQEMRLILVPLERNIEKVKVKIQKRLQKVTHSLEQIASEGRNCRIQAVKQSPDFSLSSKKTLNTPHLCHLSCIQFFEAKIYGRIKHLENFPNLISLNPSNLRVFASAKNVIQRITDLSEQKKKLMKAVLQLDELLQEAQSEIKNSNVALREFERRRLTYSGKNHMSNEGTHRSFRRKDIDLRIKNRYFSSLRILQPKYGPELSSKLKENSRVNDSEENKKDIMKLKCPFRDILNRFLLSNDDNLSCFAELYHHFSRQLSLVKFLQSRLDV